METNMIVSGFGGQGTLFAGQVLAYAALDAEKHVTWIPSYGPEMRGGTARCTVTISDDPIGSPLIRNPAIVLAMNLPSLDMYEPLIDSGGLMLVNASLIPRKMERKDVRDYYIPVTTMAQELGNPRLANMVMVGALLEAEEILPLAVVKKALEEHLPERHHKTLPSNFKAMDQGAAFVRELVAV
ncbi:MAG: 2-oxoacid:acceptor oxidoreductase family protein [Anaerolineae bacterium]|jgi:2-oxoglutarate ferredoxin oxidoreductase subunit gamma|nr:2-oxoacid:acceptor oxidoreductase family protein [Anaerolineae bacterium]MBT7191936.1 2-oxoacid:acceptor oxidoreductase family protein [Anaerolineae bacterium]MBT7988595.1 2-oxoacid:acceptor oxidoreductase family protein [Anaerolineae bacterium]